MNKLVYIVGPYAAYTDPHGVMHSERENVARAVALGSLALAKGMVPIIPHVTIGCSALLLGEHGHPDADGLARRASYGDGDGGLANAMRLLDTQDDVHLWALQREDGSLSKGTETEHGILLDRRVLGTDGELRQFRAAMDDRVRTATWGGWLPLFVEAGLEALWQDAGKPAARFPRWPGDVSLGASLGMLEKANQRYLGLLTERDLLVDRHSVNSKQITVMSRALEHIAHTPHGETENAAVTYAQNTLDELRKKP